MKFDLRIIEHLNSELYAPEILERERGERIGASDYNVSCVAHSDREPSLRVYVLPGAHCYCFSCGKTYTPYSLFKNILGLRYSEIIEYAEREYDYKIPEDLSAYEMKSLPNDAIARDIKWLRQYSSPNVLDLINFSLCMDAKGGESRRINALRNKVQSIKEKDYI